MSGIVAALSLVAILAAGMWLAAASDQLAAGLLSGRGVGGAALGSLRESAAMIRRQDLRTEPPTRCCATSRRGSTSP